MNGLRGHRELRERRAINGYFLGFLCVSLCSRSPAGSFCHGLLAETPSQEDDSDGQRAERLCCENDDIVRATLSWFALESVRWRA
jgi:hypothetical protein